MNARIYRCGWCGSFLTKHGEDLTKEEFLKAERIVNTYGDYRTILLNGWCCYHMFNWV